MKKISAVLFFILFFFLSISPAKAHWEYDYFGYPYWVYDSPAAPYTIAKWDWYANMDGTYDVLFKWKDNQFRNYSLQISKAQYADPGNNSDTVVPVWTFHSISPGTWYINMKFEVNGVWSKVTSWTIDVPAWTSPSPTDTLTPTPELQEIQSGIDFPFRTVFIIGSILLAFYLISRAITFHIEKKLMNKREGQKEEKKKISEKQKYNFLYLVGIIIFIIVLFAINPATNNNKTCPRKSPYPMQPEFQRALSLISQRTQQASGINSDPHNSLYNCLDIQYADLSGQNAEGFFLFDTSASKIDDLRILVDSSYKSYDDLLPAILLSHEITHARQFVNKVLYGISQNCEDMEVEAFSSQDELFRALNNEEKTSLINRVASDPAKNNAYYALYYLLETTNSATTVRDINNETRFMVETNASYQKECNIQPPF